MPMTEEQRRRLVDLEARVERIEKSLEESSPPKNREERAALLAEWLETWRTEARRSGDEPEWDVDEIAPLRLQE